MTDLIWIAFVLGVPTSFAILGSGMAERRHGHQRAFSNPGGLRLPPGETYSLIGCAFGFAIVLAVAAVVA